VRQARLMKRKHCFEMNGEQPGINHLGNVCKICRLGMDVDEWQHGHTKLSDTFWRILAMLNWDQRATTLQHL
jgi:hypothetical protein